ncbi:MAG: hypothetical protein ABIG40_02715 [Parcubacteria group bacterium]
MPVGSDRCIIDIEFSRELEKREDQAENAAIAALINLQSIIVVGDKFENITPDLEKTARPGGPSFARFRTKEAVCEPSWVTVGLTGIYEMRQVLHL